MTHNFWDRISSKYMTHINTTVFRLGLRHNKWIWEYVSVEKSLPAIIDELERMTHR